MKQVKNKKYLANVLPCIYYGLICGSITGAAIFLFKLAAKEAEHLSVKLYGFAKTNPLYIALAFVILIAFALAMYMLHKRIPECKGGGIPRSEGVLRGVLSFRWFKTLLGTFFGSMFSFFCGLPCGSEGPAVLMGTSIGAMCGNISKNKSTWNRYIMTGGAGAGFAVATGAPLSGILFALEEIHKRFTPMLVIIVSTSVVSATYVNRLLCDLGGVDPNLLEIESLASFRLNDVGFLVMLAVVIAVGVAIFDASISVFGKLTKKCKRFLTAPVKLIILFVTVGILAFIFSDSIYSGHDVILEAIVNNKSAVFLAALLAVRLLLMLFVTDSGATGGIFIPTLAIGVLFSALAGKLLVAVGMPDELFSATVLLGMCAFIGGTLRAPLTAAVLFLELTGQFTNLFYVAVVIFTVNFIVELFHLTPFYDIALENMEHAQNEGKVPEIACFKMKVAKGSFVVGKTVRDVMWPHSTVVISITRESEAQQDMDHDGEKRLYSGDTVVVRSKFFDENEVKSLLLGLVGDEFEITRTEMQ